MHVGKMPQDPAGSEISREDSKDVKAVDTHWLPLDTCLGPCGPWSLEMNEDPDDRIPCKGPELGARVGHDRLP